MYSKYKIQSAITQKHVSRIESCHFKSGIIRAKSGEAYSIGDSRATCVDEYLYLTFLKVLTL